MTRDRFDEDERAGTSASRLIGCDPVDTPHVRVIFMWYRNMSRVTPDSKLDLLQGTLDLMVLQILDAMGPLHGYGIARRIEQLSGNGVLLNQGTIYASLVCLQQRRWMVAAWACLRRTARSSFVRSPKAAGAR